MAGLVKLKLIYNAAHTHPHMPISPQTDNLHFSWSNGQLRPSNVTPKNILSYHKLFTSLGKWQINEVKYYLFVCWHTKLTIHAVPLLRWVLVDQAGCGRLRMSLFLHITVLVSHNNTIISEGDLLHYLYPRLSSKMSSKLNTKLYKPKNLHLNIWFCFGNKQKELVCTSFEILILWVI